MLVGSRGAILKAALCCCFFLVLLRYLSSSNEGKLVDKSLKLRKNIQQETSFELCVLARYSHSQERKWLGFIGSLFSASSEKNRIQLVFLETDGTIVEIKQGHQRLASLLEQNIALTRDPYFNISISKLTNFHQRTKHYRASLGIPEGKQDFGYVLTDVALDDLVNSQKCEYILITNGDNLYHGSLMEATSTERKKGVSMIGMHMVSHHEWTIDSPNIAKGVIDGPGQDIRLKPNMKPNEIDLGAVLWHTDSTLSNPQVRFSKHRDVVNFPRSVPQSFWTADGQTIGFAASLAGVTSTIIPRILFVHL